MEQELEERLVFLEESKHSHFNIAERISGQIEPIDVYAFMVLKRSLSLVFGFTTMLRARNFLCASPLIRLQIDNLLRFRAAFLVVNQSQFVVDVIQGKEVRQLKDRTGRKMIDAHLQDVLSSDYPWLRGVYKKTSGYVHLSEEHFFNTVRASESGQEGAIEAYIGPDDKLVSNAIYQEALEDMILVTHSLLTYLSDWATGKGKP
ncbi:MAG: hypothetical protein K1X65_08960 [Caldilineales bacterium]|nr:hypothetical protein [Caldilineales bacterium]MCW5857493.1 hypothetical protein [Caldilineales bacterium]